MTIFRSRPQSHAGSIPTPSIDEGAFDGWGEREDPETEVVQRVGETTEVARAPITEPIAATPSRRPPPAAPPPVQRATVPPVQSPPPRPPTGRHRPKIPRTIGLLVALVVLLGLALIVETIQPAWFGGLRNTVGPTATPPGGSGASTPTSAAANAPASGTNAHISAIQPQRGVAGQTIVVTGTNLISPSGSIVARFGTRVAPTACPTAERCVVTVPPPPSASSTVKLRLQLGSGLSNALTFTYS